MNVIPRPAASIVDSVTAAVVQFLMRGNSPFADLPAVLDPDLRCAVAHSDAERNRRLERQVDAVRQIARFAAPYVRLSLTEAVRHHLETRRDADIRRFFLEPEETYTITALAALWRIPLDDARAMYHDDLEEWNALHPETPDAMPIVWADALGATAKFNLFRPADVERALGEDFVRVRPASWRAEYFIVGLPQWLVEAMQDDVGAITLAPSNASVAMRIERAMLDLFEEEHDRITFTGAL